MKESIFTELNAEIQMSLPLIAKRNANYKKNKSLLINNLKNEVYQVIENNSLSVTNILAIKVLTSKITVLDNILLLALAACYYWDKKEKNWSRNISSSINELKINDEKDSMDSVIVTNIIDILSKLEINSKILFTRELDYNAFVNASNYLDFINLLNNDMIVVVLRYEISEIFLDRLFKNKQRDKNMEFRPSDFLHILNENNKRTKAITFQASNDIFIRSFVINIKNKALFIELISNKNEIDDNLIDSIIYYFNNSLWDTPVPLFLAESYLANIDKRVVEQIKKAYLKYLNFYLNKE